MFDEEQAAFQAVQRQEIKSGDIVVIRYEGPKGGPGMREMLAVTSAIVGQGLFNQHLQGRIAENLTGGSQPQVCQAKRHYGPRSPPPCGCACT